ncbi:MAG TPA: alpha/beta fold hydrolase [Pseudolysinimonas sp.]|nr:alpha/beta fold hydrolase [Pseudolysinimonas sp.]
MTVRIAATEPRGPENAPLLVLGPSLGTSTLIWESAAALLRESFRVVSWDLPGHGAAPHARESFTVADLADAVVGVLDELNEPQALYAGVSLGGAVGLELALRHPERVRAAAILCSGAFLGGPEKWLERAESTRVLGTASLVVPSAQRWFAPESMVRSPEITGRLLHTLRDADDESYALCCEALAAYDVRDRLAEITIPVLAVWGEHDPVVSEPAATEIATGVQRGYVDVIHDASHLAPAEQPAAVADRLIRFFTKEIS